MVFVFFRISNNNSTRKDSRGSGGPDCHFQLTHHSDRGMQYCSDKYVRLLESNNIGISMTENGDPLENAIAERVNGIIKEEYLNDYQINNIEEAKELLEAIPALLDETRIKAFSFYKIQENKKYSICPRLFRKEIRISPNCLYPVNEREPIMNVLNGFVVEHD